MGDSTKTLSSKTTEFFSWMQIVGLLVFIAARSLYPEVAWLAWLGFALMFAAYLYRTYLDWKLGHKKAFKTRLFVLLVAIAVGLLVGYLAGRDN